MNTCSRQCLVIRAVSPAEAPLLEQDLRGAATTAANVVALAREYQNADSAYEVEGYWNLWQREADSGVWYCQPERLLLTCNGEAYDGGMAAELGHFVADIGFEHLFAGHARLLGSHGTTGEPSDPLEAAFVAAMSHGRSLHEYSEKIRENIQKLLAWVRAVEQALPVERYELRSEGEESFEARLDEILAAVR